MKRTPILPVIVLPLLLAACATRDAAVGEPSVVITLPARDAALKTKHTLRFEVIDEVTSVGWWSRTDDEIRWALTVKEAGKYSISINLSCDEEFVGSRVKVAIGGHELAFFVPSTDDWAVFQTVSAGKAYLSPGELSVVLTAPVIPNGFVCNVRNLRLTK